ncbi:hypothetical protein HK104_004139, partial [Borealophlyctis nickersoniae]
MPEHSPVPEEDHLGPSVFQCFVLGLPLPITFTRLPRTDSPTSWYKQAWTSCVNTVKTRGYVETAKKGVIALRWNIVRAIACFTVVTLLILALTPLARTYWYGGIWNYDSYPGEQRLRTVRPLESFWWKTLTIRPQNPEDVYYFHSKPRLAGFEKAPSFPLRVQGASRFN